MNYFESLINFLVDKRHGVSSKASIILLALVIALLINNLLGISYYYNISRKVEQIEKINQLLTDTSLTPSTRKTLTTWENEIINRKSVWDNTVLYVQHTFLNKELRIDTVKVIGKEPMNDNPVVTAQKRNNTWFFISSSFLYLLSMLTFPLIYIFMQRDDSWTDVLAISLLVEGLIFLMAWLHYWVFSFIPMLCGSWTWNYVLNVVLQSGILITMSFFANRSKKKIRRA